MSFVPATSIRWGRSRNTRWRAGLIVLEEGVWEEALDKMERIRKTLAARETLARLCSRGLKFRRNNGTLYVGPQALVSVADREEISAVRDELAALVST